MPSRNLRRDIKTMERSFSLVCGGVGAGKDEAMEEVTVDVVAADATDESVPEEPPRSLAMDRVANLWSRASRSLASEQKLKYLSTILV